MEIVVTCVIGLLLVFGFVVFFGAPYVPTKPRHIRRALSELYPVGPHDTLVDLGSGDGSVLVQAAKLGARVIGVELNPILALLSMIRLIKYKSLARVMIKSMWQTDLPRKTTVVYVFSDSRDIKKLVSFLKEQTEKLGTSFHVISYAFELPGLTPKKHNELHYLYEIKPLQLKNHKL